MEALKGILKHQTTDYTDDGWFLYTPHPYNSDTARQRAITERSSVCRRGGDLTAVLGRACPLSSTSHHTATALGGACSFSLLSVSHNIVVSVLG